jgi:ABC-2 type transport system ATP-binding protein
LIEVKNLVKKYGDHVAVDHLSFTVEKGQIYGFLGPNGAGKSTTMNIITGYISATEGEVVIDGHNILDEPEAAKKSIGYLPEQPPLYMDMTVIEYLKFVSELKGIEKSKRADMIKEVMEITKITDMSSRLIKNLSKGYRQRVGLAQAIMGYPEVIILDEPTVGLDPKQIIEIRDLIKRLSKKHTVILSSHILSEVSAICDYIMIINNGKLVASDTPANLERQSLGANILDVCIRGSKEKIIEVLRNNVKITKYDIHNSTEKDAWDVNLKSSQENDVREELFYALSAAKCPILMMKSSNVTLEDIFLKVTETAQNENRRKKPIEKKRFKTANADKKGDKENASGL